MSFDPFYSQAKAIGSASEAKTQVTHHLQKPENLSILGVIL